jgi:hypothetical protein
LDAGTLYSGIKNYFHKNQIEGNPSDFLKNNGFNLEMPYGPVSAKVNNKVEGLNFKVYYNKDIEFLDITSPSGMRTYVRSLCFILVKAVEELYPTGSISLEHPVSKGYFCDLHIGRPVKLEDVSAIKQRMQELIAEETDTPEATPDEPSTDDAAESDANDAEVDAAAPNTNEEEPEHEENHTNDNNLKAALAQERARRKAAEERARQFEAQQRPITLPDSEVSDIRDFVRREALKRFNLTAEDLESLMFEDVNKYNDFIRFEANAEYTITNQ